MAYTMAQLHGLPHDKACLFGLPHIGAEYIGEDARKYRRTSQRCIVCGKPSTNCHHVVPLSNGSFFDLETAQGTFRLRSPLFALCGSGTTGCHNEFHGGARLRAAWVWDAPEFEDAWWDGSLLADLGPHSEALYDYGCWEITDRAYWVTLRIRGKGSTFDEQA